MAEASAVKFGLIGGSSIAERSVLPAIQALPGARVALVASRSEERRRLFAERFGAPTCADYEQVLTSPGVDAVYISLPNALHEQWSLAALAAGKHVLCEKPAVLDLAGAERVAALALQKRLVFLEGFMFLFHPQHAAVRRLIDAGAIGEPRQVDAWFGIPPLQPSNIRLRADLGGGAFNDAAGYPLHAARMLLRSAPRLLGARLWREAEQAVDQRGLVALEFSSGSTATASFGFGLGYRNAYAVWGREGQLLLERAFSVPPDHVPLVQLRDGSGRQTTRDLQPANHFERMLDQFIAAVEGRRPFDSFLPDFLTLAGLMDQVRRLAPVTVVPR